MTQPAMTQPATPVTQPAAIQPEVSLHVSAPTRTAAKRLRLDERQVHLAHERANALSSFVGALLDLPARSIGGLPCPPRLTLATSNGEHVHVALDGSEGDLDAAAWAALVRGVEADRVWSEDLGGLVSMARAGESLQEAALLGANPDLAETWSLRRVLRRLGVDLVSADLTRMAA